MVQNIPFYFLRTTFETYSPIQLQYFLFPLINDILNCNN